VGARGAAPAAAAAKAVHRGAADVADALLDQIVQLQGGGGGGLDGGEDGGAAEGEAGGSGALFSRLLALHALAAADPLLAAPPRDPQRFVRALAPYAAAPDAEALQGLTDGESVRGGGIGWTGCW
jgi:hypothetical protein